MPAAAAEERPAYILPAIVLAQFAGTSLWFATNAVLPDLQRVWQLPPDAVASMTSSVQLGFIAGTLVLAFFTVTDRYSPRALFLAFSILGALFNLCVYLFAHDLATLLLFRFLTGVCLAGIYPVGMKIASGWYREGLGNALGFLVGALVVGTALPHLLRGALASLPWESVLVAISCISAAGGLLIFFFVPDGPYLAPGAPFTPRALGILFRSKELRAALFGYFGHMWELYTFYVFVPTMLAAYAAAGRQVDISLWSFAVIGAGGIGCAAGGLISRRAGSARVAWVQLLSSGMLCACSPLLFRLPEPLFLGAFVLWGMVVVGDSPQFSALIARYAPRELVGSALTISVSIGFAITIVSIEVASSLLPVLSPEYLFTLLAAGPAAGLLMFRRLLPAG